jgi:uncharacterized damage-inducible protein DinB
MRLQTAGVLAFMTVAGVCGQESARTIRSEFLTNFDDVTKKIISLAEAIPEEKYTWRPAQGVRSVSEVFMHITGANLMIPTMLGVKMPAGLITRDSEKTVTKKAEVIPLIRKSVDHSRAAISEGLQGDVNKPTKVFGRDSTYGGASLLIVSHLHEHLGQLIAYARSVGVTPPWSQGRSE